MMLHAKIAELTSKLTSVDGGGGGSSSSTSSSSSSSIGVGGSGVSAIPTLRRRVVPVAPALRVLKGHRGAVLSVTCAADKGLVITGARVVTMAIIICSIPHAQCSNHERHHVNASQGVMMLQFGYGMWAPAASTTHSKAFKQLCTTRFLFR